VNTPAETVVAEQITTQDRLHHRLTHFLQYHWRTLVLLVPFLWLLLFFLAPFFFVLKISLAEYTLKSPPYTDLIQWADEGVMQIRVVVDNFAYLWEDDLYVNTYLSSVKISTISTILCLLVTRWLMPSYVPITLSSISC
jgi:putrescine transport system permease protein